MCWWKEAVVYQIYPRSFKDSNGDGIGDLPGIVSQIEYLERLGVDVIWLSPVYSSPQVDNGYDIADYYSIDECFGTMEDFDALLLALHSRKMKLVLDLVVNHTSDEHQWFQAAQSSRLSPFYNFYHWWPAERGEPPSRWSSFDPNSNAWTYNERTNSFYLHYFSSKQPDLNWENGDVRKAIYSMMRFWLDKGVDGFRMDVITLISKDLTYPAIPDKFKGDYFRFYAAGPHLHDYLREMRREVFAHYDVMTLGEGIGVHSENILDFVDAQRKELDMMYHFEGTGISYLKNQCPPFSLADFKNVYTRWDQALASSGWGTVYLSNHDQPRSLSRFGDGHSSACAKLLVTFLLSMRSTPIIYQGEELGMSNPIFNGIGEYRDIATVVKYDQLVLGGGDGDAFLREEQRKSRDNARTPMQWTNDSPHAGFSSSTPWIKVNENFRIVNVRKQEEAEDSCLNFFRRALTLRREKKSILVYGAYEAYASPNPQVYAYTRSDRSEKRRVLVALNFSSTEQEFEMPECDMKDIWLNNYDELLPRKLLPWQALITPLPFCS